MTQVTALYLAVSILAGVSMGQQGFAEVSW